MLEAQKQVGLSDERVARRVPVSTRTWIRWRKRGEVPVASLDRIAEILELEIERPKRTRVMLPEDDRPARRRTDRVATIQLDDLQMSVARLSAQVEEVLALLRRLLAEPPSGEARQ
jgi:transcriptional regulator with XRE-family HTH domain